MRGRRQARHFAAATAIAATIAFAFGCAGGSGFSRGATDGLSAEGIVTGRVTLEGEIPRSWRADSDAWPGGGAESPEGWDGTPPREIEVDASSGVRGVAVWLEPEQGEREAKAGLVPEPVTVLMEGSCFWPMTVIMPRGGSVRFVNADARLHHVEFLSREARDGVRVRPGESADVKFEEPDLIRMTCNDHAFMRADLIVTPGPWAAVTDAAGRFEIADVPEGRYRLRFAHHRLKEAGEAPTFWVGREAVDFVDLRAGRGQWPY